jgi:hypothetical protein
MRPTTIIVAGSAAVALRFAWRMSQMHDRRKATRQRQRQQMRDYLLTQGYERARREQELLELARRPPFN